MNKLHMKSNWFLSWFTQLSIAFVCLVQINAVNAESLFDENRFKALAADRRAHQAGDNLTVLIVENAQAAASAGTSSEQSSGVQLGTRSPSSNKNFGLSIGDEGEGQGRITRSGKLLAQMTVQVVEVSQQGLLRIKGEQRIEVNDETQFIALEGWVRPSDIAANNTVLSNRLSDARIRYVGEGVLGNAQKPGVLTRFIHWLGL